jgi:uncharacterized iron-regulated membrane protein
VRRLILKLHLWLAMIAGAFMVILGITGSVIAFEPELDRLFHPHLSRVKPGGTTLSLVEIGEAASKKYGSEPVVAYLPSSSPDVPAEVILSSGVVSVNQYTGEVLGLRTRGQTEPKAAKRRQKTHASPSSKARRVVTKSTELFSSM